MSPSIVQPGTVLQNTYRLVRCVGTGGMGEVWEATHARLAGRFAVKLLHREVSQLDDALQRFRREAEITSALRHPNIVQVVDFNVAHDGSPYMVMEFLYGEDLASLLGRQGAVPLKHALPILEQAAAALGAAHSRGVVHRDLKPHNVFLVSVEGARRALVKVLDFGISKVRTASTSLTQDAALLGTPQYMAPEQALGRSEEIDPRADQFALAAIFYQMIAGRPAFIGDSLQAILFQVVYESPPALQSLLAWAPPELDGIVRKAMAKEPKDRFSSVAAFAKAVARSVESVLKRAPATMMADPDENEIREALTSAGANVSPTVLDAGPPAAMGKLLGPGGAPSAASPPWPASAGAPITAPDGSSPDPAPAVPALSAHPPLTTFSRTATEVLPQGGHRRRWAPLLAVFGGMSAAAVVGMILFGKPQPAAAPPAIAAPAAPSPEPVPPPAPASAPTVEIDIDSDPPSVIVSVDGARAVPPLRVTKGMHVLRFEAPGYEAREIKTMARRDRVIPVVLVKAKGSDRSSRHASSDRGAERPPAGSRASARPSDVVDPFSDRSPAAPKAAAAAHPADKPADRPADKKTGTLFNDL